jgi:hypothetical protein
VAPGKEVPVHFHTPFHPFEKHPMVHFMDVMNLLLILLGLLVALIIGPGHLE